MTGSAADTVSAWRIEETEGKHLYRLVNLMDHSAWQIIVHNRAGDTIEIAGHVTYAHGSFEVSLDPGQYQLKWQITPSMLPPRDGEPPPPKQQSAPFVVPLNGASPLNISLEP